MWCEIVQRCVLKLVVQRLPEGTQQGLPRCVTSGLIEITSAANQSLLAGQSRALMALSTWYQQVQVEHVSGTVGKRELHAIINNNQLL